MGLFGKKKEVSETAAAPVAPVDLPKADGAAHDYVFHFTGKGNQSYVLEDSAGILYYEAACEGFTLIKDTPYLFRNYMDGTESRKMTGHTTTYAVGNGRGFRMNVSSSFKMDGTPVWDVIYDMGYDFAFRMNGLYAHYTIIRNGREVGYAELAGTGAYNPKYKDSPAGKIPANGIFRVHCLQEDIPGVFLLCFAITKTEMAMNNM